MKRYTRKMSTYAGCVTEKVPQKFKEAPFEVESLAECVQVAQQVPQLCQEFKNGKLDKNSRCLYVAFKKKTFLDLYNQAKAKADQDLFDKAWRSTPVEVKSEYLKKAQNNQNWPGKGWLSPDYIKRLQQTVNTSPEPVAGKKCYVGGAGAEFCGQNAEQSQCLNKDCNFGVYDISALGAKDAVSDRKMLEQIFVNGLQKKVAQNKRKQAELKRQMKLDTIRLQVATDKNVTLDNYQQKVRQAMRDWEYQQRMKQASKKMMVKHQELKNNSIQKKLLDSLRNVKSDAIQKTVQQLRQKKQVLHKMDADLNVMKWSILENEKKAKLHNKIMTVLGILIMLFVALCVSILFYYSFYGVKLLPTGKTKTSNLIANIFGATPVKGGPPGGLKNKTLLSKIFS